MRSSTSTSFLLLLVLLVSAHVASAFVRLVVHDPRTFLNQPSPTTRPSPRARAVDLLLLRGPRKRIISVWKSWRQRRRNHGKEDFIVTPTIDAASISHADLASLEEAFSRSAELRPLSFVTVADSVAKADQEVYGYFHHHSNGQNNTIHQAVTIEPANGKISIGHILGDFLRGNHKDSVNGISLDKSNGSHNNNNNNLRTFSKSPSSKDNKKSLQQSSPQQQPRADHQQVLEPMYRLPAHDNEESLTTLEREFRSMLAFFCNYTRADLYTIRDPRVRTILQGVISSSDEPAVYRAFEVLYEDLPPLRLAGRMIFAKLRQIMQAAATKGHDQVEHIVQATGLSAETVQVSRLAFLTLAIATEYGHHDDSEAHLTTEQLVDSGLADTAMDLLGYDQQFHTTAQSQFVASFDVEQTGRVSFSQFMIGLQAIAEATCATEPCDPARVLQTVAKEMEPALSSEQAMSNTLLDKRRQEYSDRYDMMVSTFQEWDDVVPTGEGRRLDVLRGCFVGAQNKPVVEALRVVYIDYAPLRLAGNSIFALSKTLVSQLRKRQQNNNQKSTTATKST